MSTSELTAGERLKVGLKHVLASALVGAFRAVRMFSAPAVTIVAYHRIVDETQPGVRPYIAVTAQELRRQIRFFRRHYTVITLAEAVERIENDRVDKHYLVVTFDDGYRDNHDLGLEVFRSEGIQPAIFITTGCVDGGSLLWPDLIRQMLYAADIETSVALATPSVVIGSSLASRIRATKAIIAHVKGLARDERDKYLADLRRLLHVQPPSDRLMLDWNEVRSLQSAGATIGSHTVTHQILSRVDEGAARSEVVESKRVLEERTGRAIQFFAYPNGTPADFTADTIAALRDAGYRAAVTTMRGRNKAGADLFRLRRTGIYLTDTLSVVKLKLAAESFVRAREIAA